MPSRSATAQASAIATMVTPAMRLLQSFAAWPAPAGPTCTTRVPSASRSGRCLLNVPRLPPTMIVSEAAPAPVGPPLTGASRDPIPARPSSSASVRASDGGPVDMSMTAKPRGARERSPEGPSTTSSTTAGEGSERNATVAASAASAGVAATVAPRRSARAGSTSTPITSCPAASRLRAIGSPIVPRPMKATRVMPSGRAGCELAAERGEPGKRPPGGGQRHPDDDLVVARGVRDTHLEGLVVRPHRVVVLVLEREVDRGAGRAALLRRGKERASAHRSPDEIPEAEVVDDRRPVLHLAAEPDESSLPVALDVRAIKCVERSRRQEPAERLAVGFHDGFELLDEASREWVLDDRAGGREHGRRLHRSARLGPHLFDDHTDSPHAVHRPSIGPGRRPRPRSSSPRPWRVASMAAGGGYNPTPAGDHGGEPEPKALQIGSL